MNMKLLVLAPRRLSKSTKMVVDEAKNLFSEINLVPINRVVMKVEGQSKIGFKLFYKNIDLLKHDYLFPRIDSKRVRMGYHIIRLFDIFSMKKPYNAETILYAHNKFATIYKLKSAGLPVPMTYYTSSKESASELINTVNFPVVIKLVDSFGGKGVMFLESEETAKSVIKTLDLMKQDLMIEDFVENPGEDIRILVIGDDYVSMKRVAPKGDLRANIRGGGKAEPFKPSEEQVDLAFKASSIIGSQICGVDMIESSNGTEIIEVNINPGIVSISKASNTNVAKKIAEFCYKECKS